MTPHNDGRCSICGARFLECVHSEKFKPKSAEELAVEYVLDTDYDGSQTPISDAFLAGHASREPEIATLKMCCDNAVDARAKDNSEWIEWREQKLTQIDKLTRENAALRLEIKVLGDSVNELWPNDLSSWADKVLAKFPAPSEGT